VHYFCFFFQAEDGIRDFHVTGVQTCALPIFCQKSCSGMIWTKLKIHFYKIFSFVGECSIWNQTQSPIFLLGFLLFLVSALQRLKLSEPKILSAIVVASAGSIA